MSCFVTQLLLALFPNLISLMLSTFLLLESVQKKDCLLELHAQLHYENGPNNCPL